MFGSARFTRWYDPLLYWVVIPFCGLLVRCLMGSCRVVHVSGENERQKALAQSHGRAVYTTWHQRIAGHYPHFKNHPDLYIMISQSRDGSLATALAGHFGLKAVRGSSSKGGGQALKAAISAVTNGGSVGMLADGPRGPARRLKRGAMMIAQATQIPVVPMAWGASRCWIFNSWDRHLLPKPFARLSVFYGKPVWIPADLDSQELKTHQQQLENELNRITALSDRFFGLEHPWRRPPKDQAV